MLNINDFYLANPSTDIAAFNAALDELNNLGGGSLYFPTKEYQLTAKIQKIMSVDFELIGEMGTVFRAQA